MNLIRTIRLQNPKFSFLKKSFRNQTFKLLDIGAGNASARKTRSLFPNCTYYGLDLNRAYGNTEEDFRLMEQFYEMDLTLLDFHLLPDHFFDAIWIVHVIEHLHNGDEVIKKLIDKLKPGGYMYVEYPGKKSTTLPSMKGTLNFKDDSTHVRLYSIPELKKLFESNHCQVISSGKRRSWFYVTVIPFRIGLRWIRNKSVTGNIFWDLLGFAEYVYVRKRR